MKNLKVPSSWKCSSEISLVTNCLIKVEATPAVRPSAENKTMLEFQSTREETAAVGKIKQTSSQPTASNGDMMGSKQP